MIRRLLLAVSLFVVSACATVDPKCEQEIEACLKRCEATGGNEVMHENVVPENSTTYCEDRCKCRGSTTPSGPPAANPPTYTGNAKP